MLKRTLFLLVVVSISLAVLSSARAVGLNDALGNLNKAVGPQTGVGLESDLSTTVGTIVKAALSLVGTIFLLLTIYAGILWMTAQGKEEQIETAKKIVTATIIGLFITMSAYAITYFVTGKLSNIGQGNTGPQPTPPACLSPNVCSECKNGTEMPGLCPQGTVCCKP